MKNWFVIVNPVAGSGRGGRDWLKIKSLLTKYLINYDFVITQRRHHAVEVAVMAVKQGYRQILCVGGDGTLNEVVNGVFIQQEVPTNEITIAIVAVGTGNDWAKTFMIPMDYESCIVAINEGNIFVQDVGRVDYFEARVKQTRYFANAAGVGFDAEVARSTNALKEEGRRGRLLYLLSIVKTLAVYMPSVAKIHMDDCEFGGEVFSLTLGIGKYNGAGMKQLPNALPGDGFLDVTLIYKVNRPSVLWNIFRLYSGKILKSKMATGHRAKKITIASKPPFNLEVDGESMGTSPFEFSVVPQAIKVVVGAGFDIAGSTLTEIYNL